MDAPGVIESAIGENKRLTNFVGKSASAQVKTKQECDYIKATAVTWFKDYRQYLQTFAQSPHLQSVDEGFALLLEFSSRQTRRQKYKVTLKKLNADLVKLRTEVVTHVVPVGAIRNTPKPDFSKLFSDSRMVTILERRWDETISCIENDAPLAALIMMGGLLESLLFARINHLTDKSPIFSLKTTPRDKVGIALPLEKWGLNDYIETSHEIGWIRKPAKQVGGIIRDYRNLIHPTEELKGGFQVEPDDAKMFWPIFVQISEQVIKSI